MSESILISKVEISEKYWVGRNIDDSRINVHILRAQQSDLKPILGEYLYFDVIANPNTTANQKLLLGGNYDPKNKGGSGGDGTIPCLEKIPCDIIICEFTGSGGIYFAGVNDYLASASFARIEKHNDTFVTRSGNKNKNILESDKQPQKKTNYDVQGAFSDALRLAAEMVRFLEFNKKDYPLYEVTTTYLEKPSTQGFRITKV